ncbi:hypothetical protein PLICRDRAFT_114818 [Plicaturopsis crispa FD-325 SS-3]|nr:hypothetical protein PLICRDRAFT_114818 [Plicaturopsis crispa FD-325 SS-3]
MPLSNEQLNGVLQAIQRYGTTASQFIIELLKSAEHTEAVEDLASHAEEILDNLLRNPKSSENALRWAHRVMMNTYAEDIIALVKKQSGLHFSARHATAEKLAEFSLHDMAAQMRTMAPDLWDLLDTLLRADPDTNRQRVEMEEKRAEKLKKRRRESRRRKQAVDDDGDTEMGNDSSSDEEYWSLFADHPVAVEDDGGDDGDEGGEGGDEAAERREALITIVSPLISQLRAVMMQSTNQRCNALQSVLGIFLHSCNAPETVVELLSHMGLSISTTAINDAVTSLSQESVNELQKLGRTLLASYAYDNLDIDLKHSVPTAEKPHDTLIHLTTGTLLRLDHDVTHDDLNCSEELWKKSNNNPKANKSDIPASVNYDKLLVLHPEEDHPSGLLRRERYNAWVFLHDLVHHGPEYFKRFVDDLKEPETVEKIPVVKSKQVPAKTADVNPSTVAANGDALGNLFAQGGVGDSKEKPSVRDIVNFVILVFGDLLTGERIRSLQTSRSEEKTPWRRYQFVVYVMGLFHLKMACADAIWRTFIQPKKAKLDANSLINHVKLLRPKETGKIESKPGFRRMHEVIQHVGIVSRLDCWRVYAEKRDKKFTTLDEFAKSRPSWETLQELASQLSREEVANPEQWSSLRQEKADVRDEQRENSLLRQQYFLLYEELVYAMNEGDIGRVETCFMPWAFIFRGCGKHKRAIRMNILCNPTGKKGKFRAIDWWVEHNNLFTKVSARTIIYKLSS